MKKTESEKLFEYWEKGHQFEGYLYHIYATQLLFNKFFRNVKNKKVLDIGCGHGEMMEYFRERGAKVKGIDISPDALKHSKAKGLDVSYADCRTLPFKDNSFDIVFSIGVVEHFNGTEKAIEEHWRVCKPDGKIVVIVPHIISPLYLGGVLWNLRWILEYGIMITLGKGYTQKKFKEMLLDCGYKRPNIFKYAGSAFIKKLPLNTKLANFIEKSWFTKNLGLFLFGIVTKK